ncbi:DNA translocase FtsK [Streptomyces sp. NPDC021100]|uniref:DNA translocase FtsK n=1 Tax=Streptomyces sp. NPDC021100 TaxID=3365114 RepID=UPI0037A3AD39
MTETHVHSEIAAVGGLDRRLVWDAADLVVRTQYASRSMLQRKLRITWDETAHVLEALEDLDVVGPDQGTERRAVRIRLVEDLERVYEVLYGAEHPPATVIDLPVARTVAPPQDDPNEVPVNLTKAAARPDGPAPGPVVEGTVIPAGTWALPEDPEGDAPWFNPVLRTPEGRKAFAKYLGRQARRRMRRWSKRQRTVHGVVPRVLRGERRIRAWAIGVEGAKAAADRRLAQATVKESDAAARRATFAVLDRKTKRAAAERLQQEAGKSVLVAKATKASAKKIVMTRFCLAYGPMAAGDVAAYGCADTWGFAGALLLNLAVVSWAGRDVVPTEEQLEKLEAIEAGNRQEFQYAMTPRMFEAMLRQALTEDLGVNLSGLQVRPHEFGFEAYVWLDRMTPKKIADQLDLLESCMPGVRTSSVLLRQSAKSRNHCILVVPGSDPWKAVPELPYRAPKSLATRDLATAQVAASMGGDPLGLPMCRTSFNVVGKSRSGKSTLLRAIVDVLTATDDQIVIGIDLGSAGSGFGGLRRGMHMVVTDPYLAADVLDWALAVGQGRPALFDELGMGQNWVTSRKRPGVKLIVDEFPALVKASDKYPREDEDGKKIPLDLDGKLQEIFVTCAKGDVTLGIAGQGMTKALIKNNTWLNELPVQVMAACDVDDIKLVLPAGAMDEGWRPNRLLPAMGDEINDAGVAYVLAGGAHSEPIPYRACIVPDEEYARRGDERGQDLTVMDAESEEFASTTLAQLMARAAEMAPRRRATGAPTLIGLIRDVFKSCGDPAGMTREQLAEALGRVDENWELGRFEGDDDQARTEARVNALAVAIDAVLAPAGQSWKLEKVAKNGPRGYRLRDLKTITGEMPKAP